MASDPFTNFDSDLPFKLLQIILALLQQKNKTKLIFYFQSTFPSRFRHKFFFTFSMTWHSKKIFWQKHCSKESFKICLPHACLCIFSNFSFTWLFPFSSTSKLVCDLHIKVSNSRNTNPSFTSMAKQNQHLLQLSSNYHKSILHFITKSTETRKSKNKNTHTHTKTSW